MTNTSSPQILVVDDTPANLMFLIDVLTGNNYQVRPASSGKMALKSVSVEQPDLILMDIKLPDMDGYEVCRRLKAEETSKRIPVIFISALDEAADKVKGFNAGGVDYITKPFQIEEVLARVKTHIALSQLQKQLEFKNIELQQEVSERKRIEAELLEVYEELELRVKDRTEELSRANKQLQEKIIELKCMEEKLSQSRDQLETQVNMRTQQLRILNEELHRLSFLDGLTGIANRRYFDEFLQKELQRSKREGVAITLIMADLDFFKAYNDEYGHQAGDQCLKLVAGTMKNSLKRESDLVARFGGEEFAIVLPNSEERGAAQLAEKIRSNIETLHIEHSKNGSMGVVTISLGVVTVRPGRGCTPASIIVAADKALYEAKGEGRNRVKVGKAGW